MTKPTKKPDLRLVVDRPVPSWMRTSRATDARLVAGGRDAEPEDHVLAPLFFPRPPSVPVPELTEQEQALDELRRRHRRPARPGPRRTREA